MADDDILKEERDAFELAYDAEAENRSTALEDLQFARMGDQWPEAIRKQREQEGRPVLTINKLPSFIRQVVNDARQNRPQIKVKGVDDNSDAETANVIEGLIRNIEYVSKADIAYDTAVDCATSCGTGYIRVAIDYEYDDSFDKGLRIKRVANPFSVYGDPHSVEADGSDWNRAHVVEYLSKDEFERKYKGAEASDWDALGYDGMELPWRQDSQILVCESWKREIVKKKILKLNTGQVIGVKEFEAAQDYFAGMGSTVAAEREAQGYKITHRIMSGAEILETNEWAGQYIPIVPVYGEEINIEGKRFFRSLIHQAKDAQRMFNYWRTQATELVALAPRVPWIGEEGTFDYDPNWATANTSSHAYLMYKKGAQPPQRLQLDSGPAVGAMSEAMAANDDLKSIIGMYDASLGQRSNETSGKAIMARQREGDVSTYHFIDNLSRAIRQVGCVLVDLIPKVYSGERVIRIIGEDGKERVAQVAEQGEQEAPENPMEDAARIYDLSMGRYDVAVKTGPSYTTQREEAAETMTEIIRSLPAAAPIVGPELIRALDLPNGDEIAEQLKAMTQPQQGIPPEVQQAIEEGKQMIAQLTEENKALKADKTIEAAKVGIDGKKSEAERYKAETDRLNILLPYLPPETLAAMGLQMSVQAINTPDIAPGKTQPN